MAQSRYQKKDGGWSIWKLSAGTACLEDPEMAGIVINSRDVTDRCRAEEDARSSEKQYRLLFQGNPNPI